jgi:hypothetical protein
MSSACSRQPHDWFMWLLPLAAVFAATACSSPRAEVGGETHWLSSCSATSECGESGLLCICGVCTRECGEDDACAGGATAACFDRRSAPLVSRCGGDESELSAGVCLADCSDDTPCGAEQGCIAGACVPAASGAASFSRTEIDALLSMDLRQDRSTPIQLPEPSEIIEGADARLMGTWIEECDPSTFVELQRDLNLYGCLKIMIEDDPQGRAIGYIEIERTAEQSAEYRDATAGVYRLEHDSFDGLPPVEDPELGYPLGVDPNEYLWLGGHNIAGVPYRVLDGVLDADRFSFTWSGYDLWRDWCAQQTSYRWTMGEHAFSFCVPSDRTQWEAIDSGKLALCASADFEPLCEEEWGGQVPCPCLDSRRGTDESALCDAPACHCDDSGCKANLQMGTARVELAIAGDRMTGTWNAGLLTIPLTFRRQAL